MEADRNRWQLCTCKVNYLKTVIKLLNVPRTLCNPRLKSQTHAGESILYHFRTFGSSSEPEGHEGSDDAKNLHCEKSVHLSCVGIWPQ